jgi:hypothetical protein
MEHRISRPGLLLDDTGRLREPGWSDSLVLDYDRAAIRAPTWRIKEWDYYLILAGDAGLALTVADNGYMGLLSATVLDLSVPTETTDTIMTAFPMGRWKLPSSSKAGVTEGKARGASLRFEASEGERRLAFSWPSFGSTAERKAVSPNLGLEGELVLRESPGGASMVIATPFARPKRAFYYNQKINCQSAEGSFCFGQRSVELKRTSAFAVLDWGRGVWPWANAWLWGSASGLARCPAVGFANRPNSGVADRDVVPFGFNIGYGFGDTSAASENMVFYDGQAHKIGRLSIELDEKDFMKKWHAVSEDGRFDMTLTPRLDRAASTDFGILASIQHQVFGSWTGCAILDDGRRVEVEGLRGFCEKVINRW